MQAFIQDRLEQVAALCQEHQVKQLALFGSAARDDFDPERSDVDLLVLFDQEEHAPFLSNFFTFRSRLQSLFGHAVDLVPEGPIRNPVLRRNIQQDRVVLYGAT